MHVSLSDTAVLCAPSGGPCPPEAQGLYSQNGPNGIEYIDGRLIVAVSPDRLVAIDLNNASFPSVIAQFPEDGVQGCDGTFSELFGKE